MYPCRLSDKQKEAATALGFNEDDWDDSDDEKARYEDVDWKHLLPEVKEAAVKLGYTEEIWEGKGGKKLDIEDEEWEDLTPEQKRLLTILGYNEDLVSSGGGRGVLSYTSRWQPIYFAVQLCSRGVSTHSEIHAYLTLMFSRHTFYIPSGMTNNTRKRDE